ncbi:type I 3-dehydroquinate dehydratase [Halococcoides cellulosivorans]|uniref:3-dehydroquinate dehydratase n=2 Tax=Halococcoides cellulosivorans TaxID=1679096 RepID=A0A2R4X3L1_9EURY|nr:type I 3-dehydroquinate dehydratase [Halococcoides cellulosivorans]
MDFESFVLTASTASLDREFGPADAVEFRMDRTESPLDALNAYDGNLPIIATDRVTSEGGESPAGPDRQKRLIAAARNPSVGAIDVELDRAEACEDVLAAAQATDTRVIVSAHDFEGTPGPEAMVERLARAASIGDVGKFAVTATDREDTLDLLVATRAATVRGHRVATMAMGEPGRHTRVVAPLYGSKIGYAPPDGAPATAPGQYGLARLAELIDALDEPPVHNE